MIDADAIERVKRSTDLAAIVRSHGVELRRKGKQLVGRCPFHSPDKTPSFFVDPTMGTWKCFGACAAKGDEKSGGDAIRFVMKADRLTFKQAIAKLGGATEPKPRAVSRAKKESSNGNGDLALLARRRCRPRGNGEARRATRGRLRHACRGARAQGPQRCARA